MDRRFPSYNYPNPSPNDYDNGNDNDSQQTPRPLARDLVTPLEPSAFHFQPTAPCFQPPSNPYTHSHPTMPPIGPQRPQLSPQPQPQSQAPSKPSKHTRSKHKPQPKPQPQPHQPTPNHHHDHQQQHQHQHPETQETYHENPANQRSMHLHAERRGLTHRLRTATHTHIQLATQLEKIEADNEQWRTPNAYRRDVDRLRNEVAQAEREKTECHKRWEELGEEIEETHGEIAFPTDSGGGG